jgi:phage shock protein PspC (stress-responsive transcriptional regulator)
MNGRLYRSRDERVLAGVAGGLADYLDVDPSLVRVVWVILALFSGGGFLIAYIVMAFVVPEEPWVPVAPQTGTPGTAAPLADQPVAAPGSSEGANPAGGMAGAAGTAGPGGTAAASAGGPPTQPGAWQAQAQDGRTVRQEWREQRDAWRAQRRAERAARRAAGEPGGGQTAGLVFGLILVAVGVVFLLPLVFPSLDIGRLWPLVLVGIGFVLVIAALRPGRPPG